MTATPPNTSAAEDSPGRPSPFRSNAIWAGLGTLAFLAAMAVAYRPTFETVGDVLLALLPWLIFGAMAILLFDPTRPLQLVALGVAIGGWSVLIFQDPRWSVLSFAIYLLCFTVDPGRPVFGIALAGLVTAVWTWAWTVVDTPAWTAVLPGVVFAAGVILMLALHRTAVFAREQTALVETLRATRQELADSERERGALQERTRMAGEVHDTLAQGFTSIVLLARAGQRSQEPRESLAEIEATAEENLTKARRIVTADHLDDIDGSSLLDVIKRHVSAIRRDVPEAELRVVGTPRRLPGDIEVTLLRGTQEALRNVVTHAKASKVDVTISYLDDAVALDVRDDGVGFVVGQVSDRGALTGGQGLETLARRARALSGELSVESSDGQGSVLSMQLPVTAP